MWEAAGVLLAQAHLFQAVVYYPLPLLAGAKLVYVYAFAYYIPDSHAGIKGSVGILKYHLDRPGVFAALRGAEPGYILPLEQYFAGCGFIKLYEGAAYGGLSAAGFAYKAEGLAPVYGKADIIYRLEVLPAPDREVLFQMGYLEYNVIACKVGHMSLRTKEMMKQKIR